MKKLLAVLTVLALLSITLFAAEMRTKGSKKKSGATMRVKKSKKRGAKMRVRKVKMNWHFIKGDVNPTISFYDVSDRKKTLVRNVKIDKNKTIETECVKGHTICFGGDFKLVGKSFVAGCGKNCRNYSYMNGNERSYACKKCKKKTVTRKMKVRKK